MFSKPQINFTCGDPNGIGPELLLKISNQTNITSKYQINFFCPLKIIEYYSKKLNINLGNNIKIIDNNDYGIKIIPGKIDNYAGKIAGESIVSAVDSCMRNESEVLITMPISKTSLNNGGFHYQGHTEFLRDLVKCKKNIMILFSNELIVVPFTIHTSIKEVPNFINKSDIIKFIKFVHNILQTDFRINNPSIGILSLNPHCGDSGLIGNEEIKVLTPALNNLHSMNLNVHGPYAADGFFSSGNFKNFNAVIGMYHDQVLIPFKLISKKRGVNYTAGMPFIRTSPAHGTAFDIAGKGIADIISTIQAVKLAIKLNNNK